MEESNKMLTTCTIAKLIKIKVLWHQFSDKRTPTDVCGEAKLYVPFKPNFASKICK